MGPKECEVHFKHEGTFVVSWARDAERSINQHFREPLIKLRPEPTPVILGQAVRRALDRPESAPGSRGDDLDAALRALGIKGWSGLVRSSRSFSIEDDGSRVKIIACPVDESFCGVAHGIEDATCNPEPEEIGRLLLELWPRCPVSAPLTPPRPGSSYHRQHPKSSSADGGTPRTFGYKFRWIVIDTTDASAVVLALGLKDVWPATWDIDPYHHEGIFVSPSVLGWTYVLGLYVEPHFPQFVPLLEDLSRRFGEVQYFATHRVVELQAWAKAINGRVVRGYCWVGERGEVVMDDGELTHEEEELGFARFINSRTVGGDWEDVDLPSEEDVMLIAGRWSINPQELDAYDSEGPGFLGKLP